MHKILFMKIKFVFLFLSLFALSGIRAQITLKPTVGINFTDLKIDGTEASARPGVLIGLSTEFGRKIFFEPGIQYVVKSSEISSTSSSTTDVKTELSGIRIPLRVGINLLGDQASTFTLHGFGGVSGFFVTSVSDGINKDDVNSSSWGVFAGAGVDIWKLFVDLSYEWSLTDINKDNISAQLGKTRSFFINTGLRLNFKSKKSK